MASEIYLTILCHISALSMPVQPEKAEFKKALSGFAAELNKFIESDDGQWTIKGFIDIYKNVYTITSDTKIISKILEIHLFPEIVRFATDIGYKIVLAEHQNWYPDLSFVHAKKPKIKFAVDLKTTYRDPAFPAFCNGFTLGSHGAYFRDRQESKNIQFPYDDYLAHFCLGIIYTRANPEASDESKSFTVQELSGSAKTSHRREIRAVKDLKSIVSVIKDFDFFVAEKWTIASDRQGSGNTANIGSITNVADLKAGNGVFSKLGENWFDEYWMNYNIATMRKGRETIKINRLEDFLEFKGKSSLIKRIVPKKTKSKMGAEEK